MDWIKGKPNHYSHTEGEIVGPSFYKLHAGFLLFFFLEGKGGELQLLKTSSAPDFSL